MISLIRILIISLLVSLVVLITIWAIFPNESPQWTGFAAYDEVLLGPRSKTLWDWLDLMIVPIIIAIGAWGLGEASKNSERSIEQERQRQETFNKYIEKISEYLLTKKLGSANKSQDVSKIARTLTRTTLRQLDTNRKAEVLQFIFELKLIDKSPIISLNGADLKSVNLKNAFLSGAEIRGAYFQGSDFRNANLTNTNLCGSSLDKTDFRGAILEGTDFSFCFIRNANLEGIDLTHANITGADFSSSNLFKVKITQEQLKLIKNGASSQKRKKHG